MSPWGQVRGHYGSYHSALMLAMFGILCPTCGEVAVEHVTGPAQQPVPSQVVFRTPWGEGSSRLLDDMKGAGVTGKAMSQLNGPAQPEKWIITSPIQSLLLWLQLV